MGGEAGREAAACGLYMWVLKPRGSEETLDLLGGLWAHTNGPFFKLNGLLLICKGLHKIFSLSKTTFFFPPYTDLGTMTNVSPINQSRLFSVSTG